MRELGRPKDAAKVAEIYVAKKGVWIGSTSAMDAEVPMLRVMQHGGLLTREAFAKRRDTWFARATANEASRVPAFVWALAYANSIETPAEAKEAIEALPSELVTSETKLHREGFVRAEVGNTLLLAGRPKDAVNHLEVATNACNWLQWPVEHTYALLHLGQAHEAVGDLEHACQAYQRVVARWGTAPRSATRDLAKARLKALSCGVEARLDAVHPARVAAGHAAPGEEDDGNEEPMTAPAPPPPPAPPAPPMPLVAFVPPGLPPDRHRVHPQAPREPRWSANGDAGPCGARPRQEGDVRRGQAHGGRPGQVRAAALRRR